MVARPGRHRNLPPIAVPQKREEARKPPLVCRAAVYSPKGYLRRRYTRRAAGTSSHSSAPPVPGCDMLHPSLSAVEPGAGTTLVFVALGTGEAVLVGFGVAVAVGCAVGVGVSVGSGVLVGVSLGGGDC